MTLKTVWGIYARKHGNMCVENEQRSEHPSTTKTEKKRTEVANMFRSVGRYYLRAFPTTLSLVLVRAKHFNL